MEVVSYVGMLELERLMGAWLRRLAWGVGLVWVAGTSTPVTPGSLT